MIKVKTKFFKYNTSTYLIFYLPYDILSIKVTNVESNRLRKQNKMKQIFVGR